MNRKALVYMFLFGLAACNAKPETAETKFVKWNPDMKLVTKHINDPNNSFGQTNKSEQASAQAVNPAHGAPGHRCDIEVGAPIDSKPSPTANRKASQNLPKPVHQPKVNPAHGLAGHRCDIAVGAPLDTKPAQVASTAKRIHTTSKTVTSTTTNLPISNKNTGNQKLNPAHGQPHHRCDIAVGAPLI